MVHTFVKPGRQGGRNQALEFRGEATPGTRNMGRGAANRGQLADECAQLIERVYMTSIGPGCPLSLRFPLPSFRPQARVLPATRCGAE